MDSHTNVALEIEDPVAIVRLDRPEKLNAFTFRMVAEIRSAVERAATDERVVGIVITGTGRAFSAGLDTGDLAVSAKQGAPETRDTSDSDLPALFSYIMKVPKPVIAAVNGVAAGGGFVLAMMCDLRFAAEGASFTTAFSRRGLIAEHGTSWMLPRIVGLSRALDLLWSARRVDTAEALRIGIFDRVVAPEKLLDECRAYIRDLAANSSPRSIAVMKSAIYRHLSYPREAAFRDINALTADSLTHPDAAEGVDSFVERRAPRFKRWKGGMP